MTMGRTSFVIMGRPVPKARPRVNGRTGMAYTPRKTREYELKVRLAWHDQSGVRMMEGHPLRASINIWYAVPESYSAAKRKELLSGGAWHIIKPDVDNVVKAVLDGLNGYAIPDDSAVCELHVTKRYAENNAARVEVEIEEI